MVAMLKEHDVSLLSLEEKINTSSAAGELVFQQRSRDLSLSPRASKAVLSTLQTVVWG